ncbi:MAG: hypothetical protein ABID38_05000 [Candidatus Diapherotrites archaeon]
MPDDKPVMLNEKEVSLLHATIGQGPKVIVEERISELFDLSVKMAGQKRLRFESLMIGTIMTHPTLGAASKALYLEKAERKIADKLEIRKIDARELIKKRLSLEGDNKLLSIYNSPEKRRRDHSRKFIKKRRNDEFGRGSKAKIKRKY